MGYAKRHVIQHDNYVAIAIILDWKQRGHLPKELRVQRGTCVDLDLGVLHGGITVATQMDYLSHMLVHPTLYNVSLCIIPPMT